MAKISPLMLAPPVIFAGMAAMFYFGMFRDDPQGLPSTREGQQAPAVILSELPSLQSFDDAALRAPGVKLVNFWASWCAPCRVEHPNLEALAQSGVPIYGVNYKDQPANAVRFLDELGDPYVAVGADDTGRMGLDWGLYGVPETYVIDSEGKVVLRFAGPITQAIMKATILPAIESAK